MKIDITKLQKEGKIKILELSKGSDYLIIANENMIKVEEVLKILKCDLLEGSASTAVMVKGGPDEAISIYKIKE